MTWPGLHPYFLQAACCMLYESHRMGLSEAARKDFLAEHFRSEAIPHLMAYWDNSGDYEKIVLTAAALLEQTAARVREFSLADLQRVFSRSEPCVERLAKRGLLMSCDGRYRLFSSVFGPWILHQIAAEFSEEQSYHEWLAENGRSGTHHRQACRAAGDPPEDRCPVPPAHHHLGQRPADLYCHGRPAEERAGPGELGEMTMDPQPRVNPYIAGSPVTGTEMFYGREDVFSFIQRNLIGLHRDTPIVLYGQRRTGKTSVLYQLHRHLDPRYRCIFIDLHGLSLDGMGNLLHGIASSISRGLRRDHQLSVEVPDRALFLADPRSAFETVFLDEVWSGPGRRPPGPDDR